MKRYMFFLALFLTTLMVAVSAVHAQGGAVKAEKSVEVPVKEDVAAPEAKKFGFTAGVDYFSNYFWRGFDWYGENVGVFFPYANYEIGKTGLTLGYMGEYAAESAGDGTTPDNKKWYGADFGLSYTHTFGKSLTVFAKAWWFWYYKSKKQNEKLIEKNYDESYGTGTVGFTIDAIPLKPTFIYNHDYIKDDYDNTRETKKDYYAQFQLKHEFEMAAGTVLTLLGNVGYFNNASANIKNDDTTKKKKGVSDVGAMIDLAATKGMVTFHGNINYAYIPDKDFYQITPEKKNKHRWWSGFGASLAL